MDDNSRTEYIYLLRQVNCYEIKDGRRVNDIYGFTYSLEEAEKHVGIFCQYEKIKLMQ